MSEIAISGGFTHKDRTVGFRLGMYLFREDGRYIVYCPALDMSACGETEMEAKSSFEETLRMFNSEDYTTYKEEVHLPLTA